MIQQLNVFVCFTTITYLWWGHQHKCCGDSNDKIVCIKAVFSSLYFIQVAVQKNSFHNSLIDAR